ncbi:MAG: hypothetical protein QNI99_13285 [Woeseiaceae bacterium]|nr:hypothetical protein [Woeseiaceae bacterium]
MKRLAILILLLAAGANAAPRFEAIEIWIDAPQPVAAWQFELRDANGHTTIVGVENGDSEAFGDAPYYDRDAVNAGDAERIVVADFSLADDLPSGYFRLATVHVMVDGGEPDFELTLVTVTDHDGQRVDASISVREKDWRQP